MKGTTVKEKIAEKVTHFAKHMVLFLKWMLIAVITGCAVGIISSLFALLLGKVTALRTANSWLIFCLPLAGLLIVFLYRRMLGEDGGTNLVLSTIHAREDLPWVMAPLIFCATLLTHLFGGSAGREGAALQLGGSLGNLLGRFMKMDDQDRRVVVMCGMSAAFAAVFGTPMAAAIFALEVASIGVMYYVGLMPCVFSALIASRFSANMGIHPEHFNITYIPQFTLLTAGKTVLLAALCAGVATLLCVVLHRGGHLCKKLVNNPYLRVLCGGAVMIAVFLIRGDQAYHGASVGLIEQAMEGHADWYAFLLKMALTAVTIGCGFKGGEIVPTFCVGATFGCVMGQLLGFSPSLCAACGMVALFCGATNCPISSLLISFELFGYEGMPFFLISVAVSFLLSGTYGLYHEQTIVYSKYKAKLVNQKTRE